MSLVTKKRNKSVSVPENMKAEDICASIDRKILASVVGDSKYANSVREIAQARLKDLPLLCEVRSKKCSRQRLEELTFYHNQQVAKDAKLALIPKLGEDDYGTLVELANHQIVSVQKAARDRLVELKS